MHAIQTFLHLTLGFLAGVFILVRESLFCSADNLREDKDDGEGVAGKWKDQEENRDLLLLSPAVAFTCFCFQSILLYKHYFTTNPGFWGCASLPWVTDSRILGWSWVRVSSKRVVGGYIPRILDWSNQIPQLQNIVFPVLLMFFEVCVNHLRGRN